MNNLTTRKIVLGLLMTLVLAFSVQGTANGADLPLTKVSGDRQTKPEENTFEISFNVEVRSNTTAIYNNKNQLVNDSGDLIDSQGYLVRYATNGTAYRMLQTQPTVTSPATDFYRTEVGPETATTTRPTPVNTDDPSIMEVLDEDGTTPDNNWIEATGTYYVDASRYAYDSEGRPIYTDKTLSTSVRVPEGSVSNTVGASAQYHYNDEGITIGFTSDPVGKAMTFQWKQAGFRRNITSLNEVPVSNPDGLPTSVTLICNPTSSAPEGTYTVTITDATPVADTPWTMTASQPNTVPSPRASIEFTLYVTSVTANRADISRKGGNRILTAAPIEKVDNRFTFASNESIHYQVTKGSGTLYVGTLDERYTDPTQDLLTHESSSVYLNTNGTTNEVAVSYAGEDPRVDGEKIVFEYTGTGAPTTTTTATTTTTTTPQARLLISVSGEGTTRTVTVNALTAVGVSVPGILVTLSSTDFALSQAVTTGTPVSITLPSTAGSYSLFARHPTNAYAPGTATVTVAGPALGTLTISPSGAPVNGVQNISITARTADTTIPLGALPVTLSGTGFTTTIATVLRGFVIYPIVLPTVAGTYTLTARATGYDDASTRIVVGGATTTPTTTPTTPTTPTVTGRTPSSISISGPAARSGTVNAALDAPLLVQVLDANRTGVADARVIFRVISGRGRLSQRGNGRAIGVQTDSRGFARADFTPTDDGTITVRASATGVTRTVEFTITTGSAPPTGTPGTTTPGTTTPRTTTSRAPVVHVGAAKRPPMLWVEEGAIYALVGADVQEFAPSVDNAMNIAIGGGKVYWTEKTGESGGTINSANLNGSGVTELASIFATPMGIAVDVTNSKLYWTNSAGRIQSANLDGSAITNVIPGGLETPMDIALAGGNAYWTQGGNVRFVNLRGTKQIRNISTGTDAAGSLAIGGGKVYWTEMTGESGGTVNSANLNGTGATQLASILAVPVGIAVDTARSKLYWTNSRGRVQSADLDGSASIQNVVSGLGSPGDTGAEQQHHGTRSDDRRPPKSTATARSKYDVNGDGSVNNADSDAVTVAIAAGATDAKYDVNGDGTVNVFDLVEIIANRDPGAAGAPTLFGMKLSGVQIDLIEEQIDLLIATNDRSPAAMRVLVYLQQLLVTARPEKTQLLANYPNPFNPETWIPYELATDTNVTTHDIQHARCCDPDVAAWTSVGWLLHGSGSCGVLGWSECAWRTGCERFVFLSARNR